MTTGQKFWSLSIFLKYIEFMIYYLNSCQCFSQSEFHPSPERNATSVWSVFLETTGCLKQPYHRVWMLDKLPQVCWAQGQPHACPCGFVCPKCRRLLPTSTWVRDTACRICKHVQHFGKASCSLPGKAVVNLCLYKTRVPVCRTGWCVGYLLLVVVVGLLNFFMPPLHAPVRPFCCWLSSWFI